MILTWELCKNIRTKIIPWSFENKGQSYVVDMKIINDQKVMVLLSQHQNVADQISAKFSSRIPIHIC